MSQSRKQYRCMGHLTSKCRGHGIISINGARYCRPCSMHVERMDGAKVRERVRRERNEAHQKMMDEASKLTSEQEQMLKEVKSSGNINVG